MDLRQNPPLSAIAKIISKYGAICALAIRGASESGDAKIRERACNVVVECQCSLVA